MYYTSSRNHTINPRRYTRYPDSKNCLGHGLAAVLGASRGRLCWWCGGWWELEWIVTTTAPESARWRLFFFSLALRPGVCWWPRFGGFNVLLDRGITVGV